MVTFNNGSGADHAVVLTGVSQNSSGVSTMTYYDPHIVGSNYSGIYEVL
jgi:hypothetical protein